MRIAFSLLVLFTLIFHSSAEEPAGAWSPIFLDANDLSIATGSPSRVLMSHGSTHVPVWSLSGGTVGQSVVGVIGGLPRGCAAVKVEIVVTTNEAETGATFSDVYRVLLSQLVEDAPFSSRQVIGRTVRTRMADAPHHSRTILLESRYEVVPGAPLTVRIQREPGEEGDTFTRPTGLAVVKVTPLPPLPEPRVVQEVSGYNSWPMIQAIGEKLVCTYSRGSAHTIDEDARAVFARTSTDGGLTWTAETTVADTPEYGEVTVGKGLDEDGAMLLWVRRIGKDWNHDLYRTTDGAAFTLVASPKLEVAPMQITDVLHLPGVGMMCLWFAGDYGDKPVHSWGLMTSADKGATWSQRTIESGLMREDWPTEPSAVFLGDGRILAIGRTEARGKTQFQMISTDLGATWKRDRTNIGDVTASTPSLVLDPETGLLSHYYYERGRGLLRRRVVDPEKVFGDPLAWPESEVIASASPIALDSGNANATVIGGTHYIAYYSGEAPDTAVVVSAAEAPSK